MQRVDALHFPEVGGESHPRTQVAPFTFERNLPRSGCVKEGGKLSAALASGGLAWSWDRRVLRPLYAPQEELQKCLRENHRGLIPGTWGLLPGENSPRPCSPPAQGQESVALAGPAGTMTWLEPAIVQNMLGIICEHEPAGPPHPGGKGASDGVTSHTLESLYRMTQRPAVLWNR